MENTPLLKTSTFFLRMSIMFCMNECDCAVSNRMSHASAVQIPATGQKSSVNFMLMLCFPPTCHALRKIIWQPAHACGQFSKSLFCSPATDVSTQSQQKSCFTCKLCRTKQNFGRCSLYYATTDIPDGKEQSSNQPTCLH